MFFEGGLFVSGRGDWRFEFGEFLLGDRKAVWIFGVLWSVGSLEERAGDWLCGRVLD